MLVAADGVLLESSPSPLPDGDVLAAEYALLYRSMRRTVANNGDQLATATLGTGDSKVLFQDLTPDYFLLMSLDPDGHAGRAAFEIAKTRGPLERELVF